MIILIYAMVDHGQEPGSPLKSVGTTRLKIERTQPPVLQLTNKVLGTDRLCQVKLAFPVESEDVLKYSWRSVEIKLAADKTEGVAKSQDLS